MKGQLLLVVAVLAAAFAVHSPADELWTQVWDVYGYQGPSYRWAPLGKDSEVADDFSLVATIDQIFADGLQAWTPFEFQGVYIRFYAYGADDKPAALLREYFLTPTDPNLQSDPVRCDWFSATLSPPFNATGRHFVSVQPLIDHEWSWKSSRSGGPTGQPFYYRNRAAGESWHFGDGQAGADLCDVAFRLYGTLQGGPVLDALSASTLPRSGRLRLFGANFGPVEGQVRVGGVPAIVTRWATSQIVAYVPEAAPPGVAAVQVVTGDGASNTLPLNVTLRPPPQGRVRWRFEADIDDLWFRPALAPDGTLYLTGVEGRVYALAPDGGLKWAVRLPGYPFPYAPPAAGPDGTAYVSSIQTVTAIWPDGEIRWQYTDPSAQGVAVAPGVGPGGQLLLCNDFGLGAYALTQQGSLNWNNPGNPTIIFYGGTGVDAALGPRRAGGTVEQVYVASSPLSANGTLYAFDTESGGQNWAVPYSFQDSPFTQFQTQPVVGPDGTIFLTHFKSGPYGWSLEAYSPQSGQSLWFHVGDGDLYPPEVGPDGVVYISTTSRLKAIDPVTHAPRWTYSDGRLLGHPTLSPSNTMLVSGHMITYGDLGYVRAVSTRGARLWSFTLPGEVYPEPRYIPVHHPRFTPDGGTVYISTAVLAGSQSDPISYLYALDTTPSGDADRDGDVDQDDLDLVLFNFGRTVTPGASGDLDGDGDVDQDDLDIALITFGSTGF